MRPIRRLSFYGVRTNQEWIESCIEGVTGESKFTRQIRSMCPLFFNLGVASLALDIATKGLREAGVLKK